MMLVEIFKLVFRRGRYENKWQRAQMVLLGLINLVEGAVLVLSLGFFNPWLRPSLLWSDWWEERTEID